MFLISAFLSMRDNSQEIPNKRESEREFSSQFWKWKGLDGRVGNNAKEGKKKEKECRIFEEHQEQKGYEGKNRRG